MKARQIVEMLTEGAPAPAAPKPITRPEAPTRPAAPEAPKPKRFNNPWRRRELRPGQEPAPKAQKAQEALGDGGFAGNPEAAARTHASPQWTEERIRAALQNPRTREKAGRIVTRPDDGTPEWEDEAVQMIQKALQQRASMPRRPQAQVESVRARDLFR